MTEISWTVGRMEVGSPWGNAGGVVKTLEEFEMMARTGVGWIEPGSHTLEKRYGNQKDDAGEIIIDPITGEPVVVYHHDPTTGETTNSLGMPNQGRDQLVKEIPEMLAIARAYDKEAVFNIAPVTEEPAGEVCEFAASLAAVGVRRILVNLGCPNVIGADGSAHETLSYHPPIVGRVLESLSPLQETYPDLDFYVRTSPDHDTDRARQTQLRIIGAGVVRAVWLPNTWPLTAEERAESPLGVAGGGRSGFTQRLMQAADRQLQAAVETFRGSGIDLVMSTSIRDGERLKHVMALGAAAGAGTTFYFEAQEHWNEATDGLIRSYMEAAGL